MGHSTTFQPNGLFSSLIACCSVNPKHQTPSTTDSCSVTVQSNIGHDITLLPRQIVLPRQHYQFNIFTCLAHVVHRNLQEQYLFVCTSRSPSLAY